MGAPSGQSPLKRDLAVERQPEQSTLGVDAIHGVKTSRFT